MKPGIYFEKIWSDDDLIEIKIDSFDGSSLFSNKVYVSNSGIKDLIAGLSDFKGKVYGGIYDLRMGEFGTEYANGAFHARLHFHHHSKIHITIKAQNEFEDFGMKKVASEATLYLTCEPIMLDNFIAELKGLKTSARPDAKLEALRVARRTVVLSVDAQL